MRNAYGVNEPHQAHFVTGTVIEWLPTFTEGSRCNVIVESLAYCREHKGLQIYAWVIFDNHFHAVLSAPDLSRLLANLKRHTAGCWSCWMRSEPSGC